jgi:hypothetical protein
MLKVCMNNFFEQFKNASKDIRLSEAEKARMRANIFEVAPQPAARVGYFTVFDFSTLMTMRSAVALVLVFILAGSGSAYAAQGSLPGDLLYPIKISVNERVELALATTPKEKLHTEARLAERRVAEAQALDAQGRLDEATSIEIEKEFDKHAQNALALAEEASPVAEVTIEQVADESGEAHEDARSAKVTLKIAQEDEHATTSITMTAPMLATSGTTTVRVEDDNSNLFDSLDAQREVLKKLKIRAMLRAGAEVRGESEDTDGKGKGVLEEKVQIDFEKEGD